MTRTACHTWSVLRVLSVFVLAGAVLLAPTAILACEVACATADAEMTGPIGGATHACHHAAPKPDAPFAGAVHSCTHIDGLPTTFAERTIAAPLPPIASFVLHVASISIDRRPDWRTHGRPPDRSPRQTPLRI